MQSKLKRDYRRPTSEYLQWSRKRYAFCLHEPPPWDYKLIVSTGTLMVRRGGVGDGGADESSGQPPPPAGQDAGSSSAQCSNPGNPSSSSGGDQGPHPRADEMNRLISDIHDQVKTLMKESQPLHPDHPDVQYTCIPSGPWDQQQLDRDRIMATMREWALD